MTLWCLTTDEFTLQPFPEEGLREIFAHFHLHLYTKHLKTSDP